jgi:hypothetical protein
MGSLIAILLLYVACVKGWIMNLFFLACAIVDALKDVGCQAWIGLSSIWKRRKKVKLDITEEYYHK